MVITAPYERTPSYRPWWLNVAIERYVELAYGAARGSASLDEIRDGARRRAGTISEPISSLATWSDVSAAGYRGPTT